jgi:ankyrin repeat protein
VQRIENGTPAYLEYGASPGLASSDRNLIEAAKTGCPAVLRAFLAKGGDLNARDESGRTALHWAVARRVPESVIELIAAGADLGAADRDGMTALSLARSKNSPEIADLLAQAGAREQPERV